MFKCSNGVKRLPLYSRELDNVAPPPVQYPWNFDSEFFLQCEEMATHPPSLLMSVVCMLKRSEQLIIQLMGSSLVLYPNLFPHRWAHTYNVLESGSNRVCFGQVGSCDCSTNHNLNTLRGRNCFHLDGPGIFLWLIGSTVVGWCCQPLSEVPFFFFWFVFLYGPNRSEDMTYS